MGLIKDIKDIQPRNPYNITKEDLIGELEGFPLGVVVRMLEEQKLQGNNSDIKVFQKLSNANRYIGGFDWDISTDGYDFWSSVFYKKNFDLFYKKYPSYKQYDE